MAAGGSPDYKQLFEYKPQRSNDDSLAAAFGKLSVQPAPAGCVAKPELTVTHKLHGNTSKLTATISWACSGCPEVDGYILYIRNLTWEQNDYKYEQKRTHLITGATKYKFPLWFHPGNRYRVTVKGCKRSGDPSRLRVICDKSIEFRTGEVLSKPDLSQLLQAAIGYMYSGHPSSQRASPCTYLYRNKPRKYFNKLFSQHGGVMKTYLKDASGDPRSPINGELDGLFFFANVNQHGQPFPTSPFGDTRVLIRVEEILKLTPNMYFADFHCMGNKQNIHHVTVVLTKTGSSADEFCRSSLRKLSLNSNPFLYQQGGYIMVTHAVLVDVFVTENLSITDMLKKGVANMQFHVPTLGMGKTSQGGKQGIKTDGCGHCDIFESMTKNPGVYEFF